MFALDPSPREAVPLSRSTKLAAHSLRGRALKQVFRVTPWLGIGQGGKCFGSPHQFRCTPSVSMHPISFDVPERNSVLYTT